MTSLFPHIPEMVASGLQWSSHGVAALIAFRSIYFYKVTPQELQLLKIFDLRNTNPTAIKFHPTKPYLAISQDNGVVLLYDLIASETIAYSKPLPNGKMIIDIDWANSLLIALSSNHLIYAIDFWPYEADVGAFHARFLWETKLDNSYTRLNVAPSHLFDEFYCLLSSPSTSICVIHSLSPRIPPSQPVYTNFLNQTESSKSSLIRRDRITSTTSISEKFNINDQNGTKKHITDIVDIFFHPHIKKLAIIVSSHAIFGFELQSMSLTPILCDESAPDFCKAFISLNDPNIITVITADSSIFRYQGSERVSVLSNRRDPLTVHGKAPPVAAATSKLFLNHVLVFTPSYGLNLYKFHKEKGIFGLIRSTFYTSALISCFDKNDRYLVCGTKAGFILVFENGVLSKRFLISEDKELKFVSLSGKFIYFVTEKQFGRVDVETRTFLFFDSRLGLPTNLISTEELTIVQRGPYVLGTILPNLKEKNLEKPLIIQGGIVSISIQKQKTTITGNFLNFAVLERNSLVQTYGVKNNGSVIKINSLRMKSPNAVSVAWDGNILAVGDSSGQIEVFDFETTQSSYSKPIHGTIKNVYIENSIIYAQTTDGQIKANLQNKFSASSPGITNFKVQSDQSGITTVLDSNGCLRTVTDIEWEPIHFGEVICKSENDRLLNFFKNSLKKFTNERYSQENLKKLLHYVSLNCLPFIHDLIQLAFANPVPFALSDYGRRDESKAKMKIRAKFVKTDPLLSLHFYMLLHDIEASKDSLMEISQSTKYCVVCRLAGALLTMNPPEESRELMRAMAIDFFANRRYPEGTLLLHAAKLDSDAASYLEEADHWEEAVEISNLIHPFENSLDPEAIEKKRRDLLRKAAHKLIDEGVLEEGAFLFVGIRDWHPALSVLWKSKRRIEAKILLELIRWSGQIIEQTDEDTAKYAQQFIPLDSLLNQLNSE